VSPAQPRQGGTYVKENLRQQEGEMDTNITCKRELGLQYRGKNIQNFSSAVSESLVAETRVSLGLIG
jgi:hypothetical protein